MTIIGYFNNLMNGCFDYVIKVKARASSGMMFK